MSDGIARRPESLWAIVESIQALLDSREGLDAADPLHSALAAELDAKIEEQIKKVSGIAAYRAHVQSMIARCEQMAGMYSAAKGEWERTEENLEEYVLAALRHAGKKEFVGEDGLKIKAKALPPSVVYTDEALIPAAYRGMTNPKPQPTIKKAEIAKAIKNGIEVPGADLRIDGQTVDWGDPKKKKGPEVLSGELAAHVSEGKEIVDGTTK